MPEVGHYKASPYRQMPRIEHAAVRYGIDHAPIPVRMIRRPRPIQHPGVPASSDSISMLSRIESIHLPDL